MTNRADRRRRLIGGACLAAALGMLVAGQTVLRNRLEGAALILFWLLCFLFTVLAMITAFLDVRAIRQRTLKEHRALFDHTLKEIARNKDARSNGSIPPDDPAAGSQS